MHKINKLAFIFFLLFLAIKVSAQYDSRFQFGIKAGLNLNSSSLDIEDIADKKLKIGYKVGLTGEYEFTDNFFLHTGVFYTTKGVVIKGSEGASSSDSENHWKQSVELRYIQVPVLASFKIIFETDTKLFFNIGPYISYGIGGKISTRNKYVNTDASDEKVKVNSFDDGNFEKVDYGLMFGVGIEFEKFIFGMDSEFGLRNIAQKNNALNSLYNKKSFKNKGIVFSVGYKF